MLDWVLNTSPYLILELRRHKKTGTIEVPFFSSIINHEHILTKYCNYQEYTYCYLGSYKNTTQEQN